MKSATKPKISNEMIKELVKKDFGDSSEMLYIEELSAGFFNTIFYINRQFRDWNIISSDILKHNHVSIREINYIFLYIIDLKSIIW